MAKNANSGIYLLGKYKIQLNDSWGIAGVKPETNGGIFERAAPRQNVSRAPGLWQHLKIAFQSPRFDESGRKTKNAQDHQYRIKWNNYS